MAQTLKQVLERVEQLEPAQQQAIAEEFQRFVDVFLLLPKEDAQRLFDRINQALDAVLANRTSQHIYYGEEEFMRALGMSEERIARLMAEPIEPAPDEEYDDADV